MKLEQLLCEKILLDEQTQQQVYQIMLDWFKQVSNLLYDQNTDINSFLVKFGPQIKKQLATSLEKIVNHEVQKVAPEDHVVQVHVAIRKKTTEDGKVFTQWEYRDGKLFNILFVVINQNALIQAVMRGREAGMARHWTSVVMHEIVHLMQGINSKWKAASTKKFNSSIPTHKKGEYYMDKAEIEAHAQSTVSKIIMLAKMYDDPIKIIKTEFMPRIKTMSPDIVGADSSHEEFLQVMNTASPATANRSRKLYYKKMYEKLIDYINKKGP